MLNPSTADGKKDDPTIRQCVGYAKLFGCGSLSVVNLFAYRATDPLELHRYGAEDLIGGQQAERDLWGECTEADLLICAWGDVVSTSDHFRDRALDVHNRLVHGGLGPQALVITKAGNPRHPLHLHGVGAPIPFRTYTPSRPKGTGKGTR